MVANDSKVMVIGFVGELAAVQWVKTREETSVALYTNELANHPLPKVGEVWVLEWKTYRGMGRYKFARRSD
jgi:hypothetical protein